MSTTLQRATLLPLLAQLHSVEPDLLFPTVLDALPDGILIFDAQQRIVFTNAAAAEIFADRGTRPVVSLGQIRSLFQIIDPATGLPVTPKAGPVGRALAGVSVFREEYLLRREGGVAREWIECSAKPFRNSAGTVAGAVFTFRTITDRKRKEVAIESSSQLRDFIYHENLAGIIHSTVDGRIIDCNEAILRMWGYESKQELLALRAPQVYYDPSERDRLLGLIANPRRLNEFEVCFRRKDGSRCWCLLNVRLLDAPAGEMGGSIVSTVIDITERRNQEEVLRHSEARFSAFMSHLPGVAFIKDIQGRYVYYNEASMALFQMRPKTLWAKPTKKCGPRRTRPAIGRTTPLLSSRAGQSNLSSRSLTKTAFTAG